MRGFNSSFVRTLEGAEEYNRGSTGWDEFVRRAAQGQHDENVPPPAPDADVMAILLAATDKVEHDNAPKPATDTLSALADVATSQPLAVTRGGDDAQLFLPSSNEPSYFVWDSTSSKSQPRRRLLAAGQRAIPAVNQRSLPDPFSGARQQLPPLHTQLLPSPAGGFLPSVPQAYYMPPQGPLPRQHMDY